MRGIAGEGRWAPGIALSVGVSDIVIHQQRFDVLAAFVDHGAEPDYTPCQGQPLHSSGKLSRGTVVALVRLCVGTVTRVIGSAAGEEEMRRAVLATLFVVSGVLLWMPGSSVGATGYVAYVGCGTTGATPASHVCLIGEEPGAFFESTEEVEYEVCATFPDGETLCAEEQLAEPGELYVNEITTEQLGNHLITWYVEGVEVAAWSFRIDPLPEPEPAPVIPPVTTPPATSPPPSTSPPATSPPAAVIPVAPVTTKPGPSFACVKDRQTVKALTKRLRTARSRQRRAAISKSLRKAKAATGRAC